ncbi:hypothetical protein ABS770_22645, partial [Methylobacterium brachiatum]
MPATGARRRHPDIGDTGGEAKGAAMQDGNKQDRIQHDAADIVEAATDIERQRAIELDARSETARIDAEMAELARRRVIQEDAATKAHAAIAADERRIAEDDRDIRDALNGGDCPPAHGGQPVPPAAPPA